MMEGEMQSTPKLFNEWHWEITRRCNLSCSHCLTQCGTLLEDELTTDRAIQSIDIMKNLGCSNVMITGGEPLIREDFFDLVEYMNKSNISLGLLTNGFLVDEYTAEKLAIYIKSFGVSLDGSSETTHDELRGHGSFFRACNSIALLKSYGSVTVYITVSAFNLKELRSIIDLAFSIGAKRVHISEINIIGRAKDNCHRFIMNTEEKEVFKTFATQYDNDGFVMESSCGLDLSSVYLSYNGSIYPCSEIAINTPKRMLTNINDRNCRAKMLEVSKQWKIPQGNCCYSIYVYNNIVVYLNVDKDCVLTKGNWS